MQNPVYDLVMNNKSSENKYELQQSVGETPGAYETPVCVSGNLNESSNQQMVSTAPPDTAHVYAVVNNTEASVSK